jgi:cytochrome c556
MRYGTAALAAAAIMFATAAASAGEDKPAAGVIEGRQAAMRMSGAVLGAMKGAIDRGDDVKNQGFPASALASWAKAIPGMFPAGSAGPDSGALPAVWSDRAGFEAAAAAYAAAAGKLGDAARAGDTAAFAAAWTQVRATCGGCHDKYKQSDAH